MSIINEYPHTDFHELNLDFIIKKLADNGMITPEELQIVADYQYTNKSECVLDFILNKLADNSILTPEQIAMFQGFPYTDLHEVNLEWLIKAVQALTPTPTGTITITENGTYNVTNYATAEVNVSGGGLTFYEGEVLDIDKLKFSGINHLDTAFWLYSIYVDGESLTANAIYSISNQKNVIVHSGFEQEYETVMYSGTNMYTSYLLENSELTITESEDGVLFTTNIDSGIFDLNKTYKLVMFNIE